jgi:hypothetical protein
MCGLVPGVKTDLGKACGCDALSITFAQNLDKVIDYFRR